MIVGWKIWYTDGRMYSSLNTVWGDLPDDGVLFLITYTDRTYIDGNEEKRYRCKWHARDWYGFDGDQLFIVNDDSLLENQTRYPDVVFKRGKWVTDDEYNGVIKEAENEYDLYT